MELKEGAFAVGLARKAIEEWVANREKIERPECGKRFLAKSGVFTTIYTYPERELRGCIGFPSPIMPLADAIIEAAVCAAEDPRFSPVGRSELDEIVVEVSVLTVPEKIVVQKPEDYPKKIKIGRDGLIIRKGSSSGLLLPQVPVEYDWDAETFLAHLCMKACLPAGAWKEKGASILCFRSEIFGEKKPRGAVEKAGKNV
jgi:uncharacterized protein (TIGR00296 family)